jgi:hypothetical protein
MTWQAYALTYRARASVLLGGPRLGFIQRTRFYAPGWTLWGAITARLTRARLEQAEGDDYETVGRFVMDELPTSYAHVLVGDEPARPRYDRRGRLCYGPLPAAAFEARFVASLGQTAVAPATLTAESGALHETEVLTAHDRETGEPTRWRFTLYALDAWHECPPLLQGLTLQDVLDALAALTLGADRGCGLGRLELEDVEGPLEAGDGPRPRPLAWARRAPERRTLNAHVPLEDLTGDHVRGRVVAIPWRWWQNDAGDAWGPGQKRQVRRFYAPGSQVELDGWAPVIGPRGIWQGEERNDVS